MSGKDKQNVYAVAIFAMKSSRIAWRHGEPKLDATLDANALIALSHDDARMKALAIAKEKYPESEGYTDYQIQTCELFGAIKGRLATLLEDVKWEKLKHLTGNDDPDESDLSN